MRTVAAAAALAAAAAQLVDFAVESRVQRAFDLDSHMSVFGVVSLLALGAAAVAAGLLAFVVADRRRASGVLAVLLAALLVLRLTQPTHVLYLSAPVAAVVLAALWWGALPGPVRRLYRNACIVLGLAFVAHAVDEQLVTGACCDAARWEYHIRSVVKHGTELAGWALAAGGLALALLAARQSDVPPVSGRLIQS